MLDDYALPVPLLLDDVGARGSAWNLTPQTADGEDLFIELEASTKGGDSSIEVGYLPGGIIQKRSEPRFLVENKLWMEWWQGEEYLGRPAQLINVSRHGAMIVSYFLFGVGQKVRVFLEDPEATKGVKATVLGVVEGTSQRCMHQIRLRFDIPCPNDFLAASVKGFDKWLGANRRLS